MVAPIANVFLGCERLTRAGKDSNIWANKNTVAQYDSATGRLNISQGSHSWHITVPRGEQVDVYIPPSGLSGYHIAHSAQREIPQQLLHQCGMVPAPSIKRSVPGTTHEKERLLHYVGQHPDQSKAEKFAAYVEKHWDKHAHYVRVHAHKLLSESAWAQFAAEFQSTLPSFPSPKIARRVELLLQDTRYDAHRLVLPRKADLSTYVRSVIHNHYRSNPANIVGTIVCSDPLTQQRLEALIPDKMRIKVVIDTNSEPGEVLVLIKNKTEKSTTANSAQIQHHIRNIREVINAAHGIRPAHSQRGAANIARVIYNDCQDIPHRRQQTGAHEWYDETSYRRTWPGLTTGSILTAEPGKAAIVTSDILAQTDLYAPKNFTTPGAIQVMPNRPSQEHDVLNAHLARVAQCTLPLTAAEQEAMHKHHQLPEYEFGFSLRAGGGTQFSVSDDPFALEAYRSPFATKTFHLTTDDIDPENMSGVVPDVPMPSDSPVTTFGVSLDMTGNIFRKTHFQAFYGAEVAYTMDLGAPGLAPDHLIDIMPKFGFRQSYLAFDKHMPLAGIAIGLGLGIGVQDIHTADDSFRPYVGVSTAVDLTLWRTVMPSWSAELYARYETRKLFRNAGYDKADFQRVLQHPSQVEDLEDRAGLFDGLSLGIRIAFPFGKPPPAQEPARTFTIMDGKPFITPNLELHLDTLTEDTARAILEQTDLSEIMQHPLVANAVAAGDAPKKPRRPIDQSPEAKQKYAQAMKAYTAAKQMHRKAVARNRLAYFQALAHRLRAADRQHKFQIIVYPDYRHSTADEFDRTSQKAQRGAHVVKHILTLLGIPSNQLVVEAWDGVAAERNFSHYRTSHRASSMLQNSNVIIRELRPTEY